MTTAVDEVQGSSPAGRNRRGCRSRVQRVFRVVERPPVARPCPARPLSIAGLVTARRHPSRKPRPDGALRDFVPAHSRSASVFC